MIALAWILLFAHSPVELVDAERRIPPHQWHYFDELGMKQRPATVVARFDAGPDNRQVKVALMRRDEFDRFRRGRPHDVVSETAPAASGTLNIHASADDYVVVVSNLSDEPARVRLRIWLQFPRVTTLSPERRMTVIALSAAFFLATITFSATRLLRGIRGG